MSTDKLVEFEETPVPTNPPYYQEFDDPPNNNFVTIALPPPIGSVTPLTNSINCQVCRAFINLDQKQNNLVVKCDNCKEATPIKAAPPGKKYVRCTCNGLLICKSNSSRVGCPRPHCKAIITLTPPTDDIGVSTGITSQTGLLSQPTRVICVNCSSRFVISMERQKRFMVAKCPHCQKNSSIGPMYARIRWIIYFMLGIAFLALGIGITVGSYESAREHGGYYVAYVGLLLCGIILMIRGAFYCCMPISITEKTVKDRLSDDPDSF